MSLYVDKFKIDTQEILIKDNEAGQIVNNIFSPIEQGKNILFIGDSWTVGSGSTDPSNNRFSTQLANGLNMNELNFGVGASGFARPLTFQTQIQNAIDTLTQTQKDNVKLIMVVGGVNDLRNTDTETIAEVRTAITQLVNSALNNFNNAIVCFAFNMIPVGVTTNLYNWLGLLKTHVLNMTNKKVILIDNLPKLLMGRPDIYRNDLLHPTNDGHTLIAGFLKNALMGGTNDNFLTYMSLLSFTKEGYTLYSGGHFFVDGQNVILEQADIYAVNEEGQQLIGQLPVGVRPLQNIYGTLYRGNAIVGMINITNNGNIYVTQSTPGSSFRIPYLTWLIGN